MKLLIVIVSYRVTDLTIDCLRSLAGEIDRVPGCRVAVCENGTGGDAEQRLRQAIADNHWENWVDLTAIYPNRGFTGGNNHVIRRALASDNPPEYVLLLNADTLVHPHALDALVDFMDFHPRAGIAGSQLLDPNGVVQASPFRFMNVATELDRGLRLGIVSRLLSRWGVVPPTPAEASLAEWVSGASTIIRRQVFDDIGLLDEDLYTYFDDIDFCLNARRAGWETWYVPESRIIHLEGASTGLGSQIRMAPKRRPAYWFQARRHFYLKNHGPLGAALADAAFLIGFALWRVRRVIQRKPDTDPPNFLIDSFRHSVFCTGFKDRPAENPALKEAKQP